MAKRMHCAKCNSQRKGARCFKCGGELVEPAAGWAYPRLPPVRRIRALAKEVGYAIGEHGSRQRDLDLIAAPWTEDAVSFDALMMHIAKGMGGEIVSVSNKPLGRVACNICVPGWYKLIDLSVCPAVSRG